jgi:hypothetical protein
MSLFVNGHRSRPWPRQFIRFLHKTTLILLIGGFGAVSCKDEVVAPDALVPIQIVASPNRDTLRLYDEITLSVASLLPSRTGHWTAQPPLSVHWTVHPRGDSVVADSLLYSPLGEGLEVVRAVARFANGAEGVAERRFITRPNSRPEASIEELTDDYFRRVPAGDTVRLVAVYSDPDGDTVRTEGFEWYRTTNDSLIALATGAELHFLPESLDVFYELTVHVSDPAGAADTARYSTVAYDPLTPALWRKRFPSRRENVFSHVSSTSSGLLVLHDGWRQGSSDNVMRRVVTLTEDGDQRWAVDSPAGSPPLVTGSNDHIYLARVLEAEGSGREKELLSLSSAGAQNWVMAPDVEGYPDFGPAVLEDGSLIVPIVGTDDRARLRRVSVSGDVVWSVQLDTAWSFIEQLAVGRDGTIYAGYMDWWGATLVALTSDGAERWKLPWSGAWTTSSLAIADDTTIVVVVEFSDSDTLFAVDDDGAIRWRFAGGEGEPTAIVVGDGTVYYAYESGAVTLSAVDNDGSELWRVADPTWNWWAPPALAANGQIILCGRDEAISYDAVTGTELWRHKFAWIVDSFLITESGLAVFVDWADYVEALDIGAGPLNSAWPMSYAGPKRTSRARSP